MRRYSPILALVGLLCLSACGPTTNPTTDGPTSEIPTTSVDTPVLPSGPITGEIPNGTYLHVGDQMYDFTFTDIDGNTHNLATDLQEKKMVVINFFASWCGPCVSEFPAMQTAYELYDEKAELYALTVERTDTDEVLKRNFQERFSTTFPIGHDERNFVPRFFQETGGSVSIPVSVIIDRYGTIVEVHKTSIPYESEWIKLYEKYTADDYKQPSFDPNNPDNPSTSTPEGPEKPNIEMPSSESIEKLINHSSYPFGYKGATGKDAEYNWPWIIDEIEGAIKPSNAGKDGTYSIITSTFTVSDVYKNVLTFDYLSSCEKKYDVLYVMIDGVIVKEISGVDKKWNTAYAYVPLEEGTYELTLCFVKDSETSIGEDTVYVKNMRFVSVNDISENMYVKRPAAGKYDSSAGKYTSYQTLVLNEKDGYYHVGNENGPLILADLTRATNWSNEITPYLIASNGKAIVNGKDYTEIITNYASYGTNNEIGLTPVSAKLKEALVAVTNEYGDDPSENQWQELCFFYSAYGPSNVELPSPIIGLCMDDPIVGSLGSDTVVTFDTILVPRGKYVAFTPDKTGAYRFTTITSSATYGSLYNENHEEFEVSTDYTHYNIRNGFKDAQVELYGYLEAGKTYFFRVAFTIIEEMGSFNVNIEYAGETATQLKLASDSTAFTTDSEDFNIEDESSIISRNVPTTIVDGYYYHVREDGSIGSPIYADLINYSSMYFIAGNPISLETLVSNEGAIFEWYDENGILLFTEDLTADFQKYIEIARNSTHEYNLIPVNEELAGLLQKLQDYYTFYGVEGSWMKLCYYYDYFGPLSK